MDTRRRVRQDRAENALGESDGRRQAVRAARGVCSADLDVGLLVECPSPALLPVVPPRPRLPLGYQPVPAQAAAGGLKRNVDVIVSSRASKPRRERRQQGESGGGEGGPGTCGRPG